MNTKIVLLSLLVFSLSACSLFQTKKKSWAEFKTPTSGRSEALGASSAGCLAGAKRLDEAPSRFVMMRPSRERVWGHPELVSFIERLSQRVNQETGSLLLVGDLAQARGGLLPGTHRSHQSGLDVDLWFDLLPSLPADFSREEFSAHSFVKEPKLWTSSQEKLLRLVAEDEKVERVFVNPQLKKNLCLKYKGEKWLRVLRPWWGHDDHLHVRLLCPPSDLRCEKGPLIPEGDGCGKELAWWFSEEAKIVPPVPSTSEGVPIDRTPPVCEPLRELKD